MPSYLIKDSRCLSCFLVLLFYPPPSLSLSLPGLSCLVCADLKNNYSFWKRDWQTGRKQRMGLKGAFASLCAQGFVWSWSPWNSFQLLLLLLFDLKGRLIRNFFVRVWGCWRPFWLYSVCFSETLSLCLPLFFFLILCGSQSQWKSCYWIWLISRGLAHVFRWGQMIGRFVFCSVLYSYLPIFFYLDTLQYM